MQSIRSAARGLLVLALLSATVFATEPETVSPEAARQAHLQAEAAKAAWFQSCATSVVLFIVPPLRRRVNAWNLARHQRAITDYDTTVRAAVDEVDRLLADPPPPLPSISARMGVAQFYQAMHPTAFRTGRRDLDEELTRYVKWLAIAAERTHHAWLRDFIAALAKAAPLRSHRRFRSLPEELRLKVDAAKRLQVAMPFPQWLELAMGDPDAPHDFGHY